MSTETIMLIRDEKRWGVGGVWKEGEEGEYMYHYTVTAGTIPALRWAVMRAILVFH